MAVAGLVFGEVKPEAPPLVVEVRASESSGAGSPARLTTAAGLVRAHAVGTTLTVIVEAPGRLRPWVYVVGAPGQPAKMIAGSTLAAGLFREVSTFGMTLRGPLAAWGVDSTRAAWMAFLASAFTLGEAPRWHPLVWRTLGPEGPVAGDLGPAMEWDSQWENADGRWEERSWGKLRLFLNGAPYTGVLRLTEWDGMIQEKEFRDGDFVRYSNLMPGRGTLSEFREEADGTRSIEYHANGAKASESVSSEDDGKVMTRKFDGAGRFLYSLQGYGGLAQDAEGRPFSGVHYQTLASGGWTAMTFEGGKKKESARFGSRGGVDHRQTYDEKGQMVLNEGFDFHGNVTYRSRVVQGSGGRNWVTEAAVPPPKTGVIRSTLANGQLREQEFREGRLVRNADFREDGTKGQEFRYGEKGETWSATYHSNGRMATEWTSGPGLNGERRRWDSEGRLVETAKPVLTPTNQGAAPWLGVSLSDGLKIQSVLKDGPAARAGLKAGDMLLAWENEMLRSAGDLQQALRKYAVGNRVKLEIERDGARKTIWITLEAR